MLKKIIFYFLVIGVILGIGTTISWARMSSTNYIIYADVFSIGGLETGASANYRLQDTLGEALIWSATTTSANYGIKAGFREMYADQYLTFSAGATNVSFGAFSTSQATTASHTLTIDTNAVNGFTVTVSGDTLTSITNPTDTISAIGSVSAASSPSFEQFGINLVANTTPAVGADPVGTAPVGSVNSPYDTADKFAYNSGDIIFSATNATNKATTTVSYLVNIGGSTEFGAYATTLTYAATANF